MSLQDVLGHMDLAVFPQVALFLFSMVFVAVLIRSGRPSQRVAQDEAAQIPLSSPPLASRQEVTQ